MDISSFAVLALAISVAFYVQTSIGFAAALISMPIMLSVMSLSEAMAIITPLFFLWSILVLARNWKSVHIETIQGVGVSSLIGLILGTVLLIYASPVFLKKILGIFVLLFVGYSLWKTQKLTFLKRWKFFVGMLGGFFSGVFSAGGPVFVPYIYSVLDDKNTIRATNIGMTACMNILRFPLLAAMGGITLESLKISFGLLPVFLLAVWAGEKTHHFINEALFKKIIMVLLCLSGISLLL